MPRAALLSSMVALSLGCSSGSRFEFQLPEGKTLVIRFETRVEKRSPEGKVEADSTLLESRLQVKKGGVVGRDPIQLSTRIDRVRVDRRPFLGAENVIWDSASGPPGDDEFALDAVMLGLSYDVLLKPDLETVVSNLRWPSRPGQPAEAAWLKETLTPRAIGDDFAGSLRALPRGHHEVGDRWRSTSVVTAALTGDKTEAGIWWRFASIEGGVATLTATIDTPRSSGAEVTEHSGHLRYDLTNRRPLEQTTRMVAAVPVGGETYQVATTQTATYVLE